jgi:NAD(P)-dependent dehydrogenase (short-subunit alcohol dehydrogenase family)
VSVSRVNDRRRFFQDRRPIVDFKDRVVIISGASSGIGRACVVQLLGLGATVAGFDVVQAAITNPNYRHCTVDVTSEADIIQAVSDVDESHGKINGLVNCAGIFSSSKPFYEMSQQEWERVISTNLTGTFLCSKHVAAKMITSREGKIVNISCIRSRLVSPNMADYAASKGAVVTLTSAMAMDLAAFNIQVNSVAPGFTFTGMTEKAYAGPEVRQKRAAMVPLRRIANPDDIANVVLYLLSDASNYITGQTIFVDGGFTVSK